MNLKALKEAEKKFLKKYPKGFMNPAMIELGKKHKMGQLTQYASEIFSEDKFDDPDMIIIEATKLVGKSTMVSLFEKPKFRDFTKKLSSLEKRQMSQAIFELLHGQEEKGFEQLVSFLKKGGLAKWSLVTTIPAYYSPKKEVFVKPTTAKLIIEKLELNLKYHPTPTWDFYKKFRTYINKLKKETDSNLAPSNPAYCGFLMMSLNG